MPKLSFLPASRRSFLRRSSLFLTSLAAAACRPRGQAEHHSGRGSRLLSDQSLSQSSGQSIADSTAQAAMPSATPLSLTPACGDDAKQTLSPLLTLRQTPGPFYSPNSPQRQSLVEAKTQGTRLVLTGRVLTRDCRAIANCLVDFWQADAQGNYDNQGYRLRGHQFTNAEGRYQLEPVVPGIYPGRTRHLHVRVQPNNGSVLTTQLYLPQEPLNSGDFLFRPELLVTVQKSAAVQQAQFNFVVETSGNRDE